MGVNAQTSVPAFTAGQVLTAQQQTEINTGIPVFATTTTRDAAFGGTGKKALAEGQFAYIEASNATQYYDGSTWQTVGLSGLIPISTVTISAASTTNVNNVFTSTYKNYLLTSNLTTSANTGVAIRLRASGTDNTTANYGVSYRYTALYLGNAGDATSTGQTQFNFHISGLCRSMNMNMMLFNPQAADYTVGSFNNINAENNASEFYSFMGGCAFRATTQFDGFSIYTGGAATISGTIQIYGLVN